MRGVGSVRVQEYREGWRGVHGNEVEGLRICRKRVWRVEISEIAVSVLPSTSRPVLIAGPSCPSHLTVREFRFRVEEFPRIERGVLVFGLGDGVWENAHVWGL